MRTVLRPLILVTVVLVAGCLTIPIATTVAADPGRQVSAEASKFSILWLSPLPIDTASELLQELVEECGGAVTGVTTAVNTGYAVIGQQERMIVSGYCAGPSAGGTGEQGS